MLSEEDKEGRRTLVNGFVWQRYMKRLVVIRISTSNQILTRGHSCSHKISYFSILLQESVSLIYGMEVEQHT